MNTTTTTTYTANTKRFVKRSMSRTRIGALLWMQLKWLPRRLYNVYVRIIIERLSLSDLSLQSVSWRGEKLGLLTHHVLLPLRGFGTCCQLRLPYLYKSLFTN